MKVEIRTDIQHIIDDAKTHFGSSEDFKEYYWQDKNHSQDEGLGFHSALCEELVKKRGITVENGRVLSERERKCKELGIPTFQVNFSRVQ